MDAITDLGCRLGAAGDPAKKEWWERYLKGEIEFFGVPMDDIRRITRAWIAEMNESPAELRDAAMALLSRPIAEEKLAGILIMQERLLPAGELDARRDLPRIAECFDAGHIADWNTTDWLCVRVLGPLIEHERRPAAELVAAWVDGPGLWRRRAAAVSFVPIAGRGDALFAGLVDLVVDVCSHNVADPARFAQSGVGWVLRELSGAEPDRVYEFIVAHESEMSREAVRMAAARLSDEQRTTLGITGPRRRR